MTQTAPVTTGFSRMRQVFGGAYFPVSALARLPLSMLVIGALTYVVASASDFATGGAVAAITGIGVALGAPLSGAASDRWGQRRTLLLFAALYVAALVWLLVAGAPRAGGVSLDANLAAAALVAGVVVPQAGPMTRVRWIRRLTGPDTATLDTAQGYESTIDELSFVLGPALVGIIAAVISPAAPLYVALALTVVAVPWFALHPSAAYARPLTHDEHHAQASVGTQSVPWLLIGVLLLGMLSIGTVFGSLATGSTAFADEAGEAGTGGLVYATLGITSGLAALSVSRWPARFTPTARWVWCSVVLIPLLALLWTAQVPWHLSLLLLLVGAPIGPVLVTVFTVAGGVTPARRLGLVMTLLSAGITLGTSIGNWLAGVAADAGGHRAALWITLAAGVALLLFGLLAAALRRSRGRAE